MIRLSKISNGVCTINFAVQKLALKMRLFGIFPNLDPLTAIATPTTRLKSWIQYLQNTSCLKKCPWFLSLQHCLRKFGAKCAIFGIFGRNYLQLCPLQSPICSRFTSNHAYGVSRASILWKHTPGLSPCNFAVVDLKLEHRNISTYPRLASGSPEVLPRSHHLPTTVT